MRNLFEADARKELLERLEKITPGAKANWGVMSVDQMLWHCNHTLSYAMGEYTIPYRGNFFFRLFKKVALGKRAFPKGKSKALPEWIAREHYDINIEKKRLKEYIEQYGMLQDKKDWPYSPILGRFSGEDWARIQYKHIDHHFRQFGV